MAASEEKPEAKPDLKALVLKAHKVATWKYRVFATAFLLSIALAGYFGYLIHPGLGGLIVTAYLVFFTRMNLINADNQRGQIEHAIFAAKALHDQSKTRHKGTYV